MPAPGPKDGHMSKSSRDLSKGIAVKSNGFKYGGGREEGWGTGQAKGRRLGKGQGERDVKARERLRQRLMQRNEAREKGDPEQGTKRKQERGDGDTDDTAKRKRTVEKDVIVETTETTTTENGADTEKEKTIYPPVDDPNKYTCHVCNKFCGTKNNYDNHRDSKKHKAAAQREKGKAILEAMRAKRD
ncbi:C2H2-type zinc finger protein [bacterium]|jgi:Pyruvate/2-oxoacid:ferredoxin oxidoreductase delta subunit|nr:C2H2-type zinc finger protein [bacterium]|tara:strand:+ start:32 stop:592 length:561 start_codon:yes stop_codon:yes gene_type:complete